MTYTQQLIKEHGAILAMIEILEKISEKIDSGQEANKEHIAEVLDFLRIFIDKCHHGKEEDFLFPSMEKAGVRNEGGPIGQMLADHQKGREFVKKMVEASSQKDFAENAKEYSVLLRGHIDKENNILYPMADRMIPKNEQIHLLDEFNKFENERIGPGKHEAYHSLIRRLMKIYM